MKEETIEDIITIYNNKVYKQSGDLFIRGQEAYLLRNVQYAIPFPEYRIFYEVKK